MQPHNYVCLAFSLPSVLLTTTVFQAKEGRVPPTVASTWRCWDKAQLIKNKAMVWVTRAGELTSSGKWVFGNVKRLENWQKVGIWRGYLFKVSKCEGWQSPHGRSLHSQGESRAWRQMTHQGKLFFVGQRGKVFEFFIVFSKGITIMAIIFMKQSLPLRLRDMFFLYVISLSL